MLKFNRLFPLLLALFLPVAALAQGVVVSPQTALKTVNGATSPIAGATITVCAANTAGLPCSPALVGATFKDAALAAPLANPFTADANGNYNFAIASGTYTVTVTASGFTGYSYQLSVTCPPAGPCSFTAVTATSVTASGQISTTVATGTPPLSVVSTTPVTSLTVANHPQVFNCGGVANNGTCVPGAVLTNAKIIMGGVTLAAGVSTVSGLTFTSNATYQCTLTDATAANATKIAYTSGSQITVTGTGTDVIVFVCIGN